MKSGLMKARNMVLKESEILKQSKLRFEYFFQSFSPFYYCAVCYLIAFFMSCASWAWLTSDTGPVSHSNHLGYLLSAYLCIDCKNLYFGTSAGDEPLLFSNIHWLGCRTLRVDS